MPGVYILEWRNGRKETIFGGRGYYYVFPNETLLSFPPVPSWCRHCERITLCEHLRAEDEIRHELTDLDIPTSAISQSVAKSPVTGFGGTWRKRLEVELQQAMIRRLLPSCLTCGQREVSYFKEREWSTHPKTGEEVLFHLSGMCSTSFAIKFYDVEGNLLDLSDEKRKILMDMVKARKDV